MSIEARNPVTPTARQQDVASPPAQVGGRTVATPDLSAGIELKLEEQLLNAPQRGAARKVTVRDPTEDQLDWRENRRRSRADQDRVDRLFFGLSLAVALALAAIACTLAR